MKKKKRPSLAHMVGGITGRQGSPRSKAGAKWLSKVKKGQVAPKGLNMAHALFFCWYIKFFFIDIICIDKVDF